MSWRGNLTIFVDKNISEGQARLDLLLTDYPDDECVSIIFWSENDLNGLSWMIINNSMSEFINVLIDPSDAEAIEKSVSISSLMQWIKSLALNLRKNLYLRILIEYDLIQYPDLVVGDEPAEKGEAILDGLLEVCLLLAIMCLIVYTLDK